MYLVPRSKPNKIKKGVGRLVVYSVNYYFEKRVLQMKP